MTPIEIFILRQKTRPSEEECQQFFLRCLATNKERLLDLLKDMANPSHPHCAIQSANLNRETDDIDEQLQTFIKAEGGERYLKDRGRFSLEMFQFLWGTPPEETRLLSPTSKIWHNTLTSIFLRSRNFSRVADVGKNLNGGETPWAATTLASYFTQIIRICSPSWGILRSAIHDTWGPQLKI